MMKKLNAVTRIAPTMTADDWHLYPGSNRDHAAIQLNNKLAELVNAGLDRGAVNEGMSELMYNLCGFGAADTEPFFGSSDGT